MERHCALCKGKGLCGLARCPIKSRFSTLVQVRPSTEYMGSSPSVFIGSHGYPSVQGGPLLVNDSDLPTEWLSKGLLIEDIVRIRAGTIRGMSVLNRFPGALQEIALSSVPLDVEARFERPVAPDLTFDGTIAPVGLSGRMKALSVIDNAKVAPPVDRVTSDTDLGANEACEILGRSGIDVYQISRLLSAGLLGRKRKVVPTRWAITAVDDAVSSSMKREITRFPALDEIRLFEGYLFGNRIVCMLLPGDWKFEMLEIWGAKSLWAGDKDYIVRDGENMIKKGYSPISGAYYSARLGITEYLKQIGRSARVIVVRHVSGDYWAPLGTWVVRETTRKAMAGPYIRCPDLSTATEIASQKLGFSYWIQESRLIPEQKCQRTLQEFF